MVPGAVTKKNQNNRDLYMATEAEGTRRMGRPQFHPHTYVPEYLTDSVHPYSNNDPARYRLRSATGTNYSVIRMRTKFGDRAFSVAGPVMWNSLPAAVRNTDSLHSFKRRLKSQFLACVLMIDSVMPFRSSFAHKGH